MLSNIKESILSSIETKRKISEDNSTILKISESEAFGGM